MFAPRFSGNPSLTLPARWHRTMQALLDFSGARAMKAAPFDLLPSVFAIADLPSVATRLSASGRPEPIRGRFALRFVVTEWPRPVRGVPSSKSLAGCDPRQGEHLRETLFATCCRYKQLGSITG